MLCLVTQSFLTFCDPMDCSWPGSSVHGILQARTLEWVAMPSSRVSSQGIKPRTPALQADSLPTEPPGKPKSKEWVAWWAAVYGVAQSRTRLKRLSSSSLSLLQGIFPTQESNGGCLHCRLILYLLYYQGSPWKLAVSLPERSQ